MLRTIFLCLLTISACAISADLEIKPDQPWKVGESKNGPVYTIAYQGSGWPGLKFRNAIEADSFYRLTWRMSANIKKPEQNITFNFKTPAGNGNYSYPISDTTGFYYAYVYSTTAAEMVGSILINPGSSLNCTLDSLTFSKLTPEELEGNLLLGGDFESEDNVTMSWSLTNSTNSATEMRIENNPDFLSGKKCMAVSFRKDSSGAFSGVQTKRVPVILGKEYEVKFWVKAEEDFPFVATAQAWSVYSHKGGHFYKSARFKATKDWQEFSFKIAIPQDVEKFPDLADRTVSININPGKGADEMKFFLDNISFKPTDSAGTQNK